MNVANKKAGANRIKIIIACVVLVTVALGMYFVYKEFMPKPVEGLKNITVEVIIEDAITRTEKISTTAEYLKEALDEKNLIGGSDSDFGFYITSVDGRVADDSNQEWWMISKDGEMLMVGVSDEPVTDGSKYELTLVVGYDY